MARCACGNAACSCVIKGADGGGIVVTGSGSPERPYEISTVAGGNPLDSLVMVNTPTIEWSQAGVGTIADKRRWSGTAKVGMAELTDVSKTDVPVTGDVVQWNGTEWVFASPGATAVPVSGVFGTAPLNLSGSNSLIGQPIYLDSNGQIRAEPRVITSGIKSASDPIVGYPLGVSVMSIYGPWSITGGWPFGVSGIVTTHHRYEDASSASTGYQIWVRNTSVGPQILMRNSSTGVWSPWFWVGGQAPHYAGFKTAAQAMAVANTWYTTTFENVETNEGGITYSAGVFTVPIAGKYKIDWASHIQGTTSTSSVTTRLLKTGVSIGDFSYGAVGSNKSYEMSRVVKCVAGDTIQAQARSSTAGTNQYGAASTKYTYIDISLVGG